MAETPKAIGFMRWMGLAAIVTSVIFLALGGLAGLFWLLGLSGFPLAVRSFASFFPFHRYIMVYGFAGTFIMGVAFILLPHFSNIRPTVIQRIAAVLAFTSNTAGVAARFIMQGGLGTISPILMAVAPAAFTYYVFTVLAKPTGELKFSDYVVKVASGFFLLSTLLDAAFPVLREPDVSGLPLIGFPVLMILGVQYRLIPAYRAFLPRVRFCLAGLIVMLLGLGGTYTLKLAQAEKYFLIPAPALVPGAVLYLKGLYFMEETVGDVRAKELKTPLVPIYRYVWKSTRVGYSWLLLGLTLFALLRLTTATWEGYLFVSDAYIHSLALGFVSLSIMTFAPVLLPGLFAGRAPSPSDLRYEPPLLLNLGVALRLVGDASLALRVEAAASILAFSGLITALSFIVFMVLLLRTLLTALPPRKIKRI